MTSETLPDVPVGLIGIPHVLIDNIYIPDSFGSRCFIHYHGYTKGTRLGTRISAKMGKDPRYQRIDEQMVSNGHGGSAIQLHSLTAWILWRANNVGLKTALRDLDAFLDADYIDVVNTLWVTGLNVDTTIHLDDGFSIVPVKDMVDSSDKEYFLQHPPSMLGGRIKPLCALVKISQVKKIAPFVPQHRDIPYVAKDYEHDNDARTLHYLSVLINALPNACCVPAFATSYSVENTPMGPIGGGGGWAPLYDVSTTGVFNFSPELAPRLNAMIKNMAIRSWNDKEKMLRILMRFSQAKRRFEMEDKILDLGIVLEMLLLDDNERDQFALSFRLRGSWLIAKNPDDHRIKYELLRNLYKARSVVAHTGQLYAGKPAKFRAEVDRFPSYMDIGEQIIEKLILESTPDWDSLVLDNPTL